MEAMEATHEHPAAEALARFAQGRSPEEERAKVVRHLLGDCSSCKVKVRSTLLPLREPSGNAPSYKQVFRTAATTFDRATRDLRQERAAAKDRLAALRHLNPQGQERRVEEDAAYHTWSFVEILLEECRRFAPRDPGKASLLVALAQRSVERLDTGKYGLARVRDLQARVACVTGTMLRIRSDFREAEREFQRAKELLLEGTQDPMEKAEVLINEAVLYASQARYERAFALLDHVVRIARRFEDQHLQGKALITKGVKLTFVDEEEKAIRLLYQGIELLDPEREPRLLLVAWHNIFFCLSYVGRNEEALEKLPYLRSLHEKFGNRLDLLRLRWMEGQIAAELGDTGRAESSFEAVRKGFIEAGIGYDAALVSLDLASLYLSQGDSEKVARLAQEILPIFKSRDVHREAIAALIVFQKAIEQETGTVQLVAEIEQYLRQARNDPSLRFQPSS